MSRFLLTLAMFSHGFANNIYVANGTANVAVINSDTGTVTGVSVGTPSNQVAVTPDGKYAYVTLSGIDTVAVIDTCTNTVVVPGIAVGMTPLGIAITPDGQSAYVANGMSQDVSVIDTSDPTNLTPSVVLVSGFPGGGNPRQVEINPNGLSAYVADTANSQVVVIDIQTKAVIGAPITGIAGPTGIAFTPDGLFAYVSDQSSNQVYVIDTNTNAIVVGPGLPISVGVQPEGLAVTPDGKFVYVSNSAGMNDVSVINTATYASSSISSAMVVTSFDLAVSPDGKLVYVTSYGGGGTVAVVDTSTNTFTSTTYSVGSKPTGIAIASPASPSGALQGSQKKNDFGLTFERFNALSWEASPFAVDAYYVYRDGVLIAVLSPSATQYEDHDRPKGVSTTYSVASVGCNGSLSIPLNVTIN